MARNYLSVNVTSLTHLPEAPGDFFGRSPPCFQKLLQTDTLLSRIDRFSTLKGFPRELFCQKYKNGPEPLDLASIWAAYDSLGESGWIGKILWRYLIDKPCGSVNQ